MITGSSVDISVGFSVTIIPAVHINFDWVHINTNAIVASDTAHFHLGSTSPPPVVAPAEPPPPPPTPPPLAGFVTNTQELELYVGQDAGNRINSAGSVTGAQNENYSLTRVAGDPNSSDGETIDVSALGQTQTFDNVREILVDNTQTWDDLITIDDSVAVPVVMTFGSGNNTITTGSGPATVAVDGDGNNQITSGASSQITISAAGNNVVTTGASSLVTVEAGGTGSNRITTGNDSTISIAATGSGNNQVAAGGAANVTISGNENNTVNVSDNGGTDTTSVTVSGTGANTVNVDDGTPTITVASTATGNNSVHVNTASASTISVDGGGDNSIATIGSGAATITVDGNGNNQIATGGAATNVYLVGSGNNEVSTGAGPANVYDQGTGGNVISGGTGGGTDYYGVDGSGLAYASKGSSFLTTAYDNFSASVSGYSNYLLASYGLAVGDFVTDQPVTASASGVAPGTDVVTPAVMEPYIALGADLVINEGQPDQEFVTVSAVTATTFTTTFAQAHSANFTIGDIDKTYTLGLSGVPSVTLNAASAANSFTLEGWTGNATLNGHGATNTMYSSPAAGVGGLSYVLSNSSLQVTGSVTQTISLHDIQTADLTGSNYGANSFNVSSWTGNGALTGQDDDNTLIATNDVANFTLSDTLFQRTGYGDIDLSGIQFANLTGGNSANTFTVSNWSGNASLDGKKGNNTFNLTLTGSGTGVVNIANTGSTSADIDTLNVTADRTTLVTSTSVRVGTQHVNYGNSGIDVLNVIGGTGSLIFNVQSTSANVGTTTVRTAGNSNVIDVGSTAGLTPIAAGVLSNILGALNLVGGGQDTANVDDTGDASGRTGYLTSTQLTGLGMGSQGIAYSALALLNIKLGTGGNTFTIANTASGTTTTVNSGTGSDTVNVQATSGPATVNTGGGSNLNVVNAGSKEPMTGGIVDNIQGALTVVGNGADTMNVDDTGSTTAKTGTLTATTLTGLNMGPSGITYSGLSILNISLGSGGTTGSTFNIAVAAGTNLPATTNINAGSGGRDTMSASWAGDLNGGLHLSGFATSTISVGNNFNGSLFDSNPGYIKSITIGGSLTASGVLEVFDAADPKVLPVPTGLLGDIGAMTVGGSIAGLVQVSGNITTLDVGPANTPTTGGKNDVSGQVIVGGSLWTASVSGNVSGLIQSAFTGNSLFIGGSLTQTGIVAVSTPPYDHVDPMLHSQWFDHGDLPHSILGQLAARLFHG